jgi:diacylglycerol O-acyltransferase / wax synthase
MTRPPPDFVAALDSAFLYMETARTPMHMGSIAIFEGGPLRDEEGRPRLQEVRDEVERRLHLVPKLRKVVRFPLRGRPGPVWVDDPHFDIAAHVRQVTLPHPGDDEQLLAYGAGLMAAPLDRDRPLWQLWVVDGLAGGRVAMIQLLHHALADGLAGVELATVLLDPAPRPSRATAPPPWHPGRPPAVFAVGVGEARRLGSGIGRLVAGAARAVRHPSTLPRAVATYEPAFADLVTSGVSVSGCSLNAAVGNDRRVLAVGRSMEELRRAEHRFGVTVNDLLLSAIGAGLHELLAGRGERTEGRTARVLVPVGMDHDDRALGNRVSIMIVRVPVGPLDPLQRLRAVAAAERSGKQHRQASATELVLSTLDAWLPTALAAGSGLVHHQPFVNLVVTNVRGVDFPLYALGARMLEVVPIVPLGGNLSVGVAALSYDRRLTIGILSDPAACPDAAVLAGGIGHFFDALGNATGAAMPLPA